MNNAKLLLIAAVAIVASSAASAQQMDCSKWVRNQNGTWSPTGPVQITGPNGSIQMGPSAAFGEGAIFMGINIAALLNAQCR